MISAKGLNQHPSFLRNKQFEDLPEMPFAKKEEEIRKKKINRI